MFKHLLFLLSFLAASSHGFSQVARVLDKTNLKPVPNVAVFSENPKASAITNTQGEIDLSTFSGSGRIAFSHLSYSPEWFSYEELKAMGFKVMLTEKSFSLHEIVVSASRFEEARKDVAQPIQVIKQKEMGFINQSTTADVMQNSGAVLVQKSQLGGGSPIIRGFETNKVLMVVDGIRMNNAIYRGGHLQNIITLDNSILEKVEIIFGPGSVVYGSDALGGVMHFYTKNPQLTAEGRSFNANAYVRYATAASELSEHVDFSFSNAKIGSLTSMTFSDFGDLRQGSRRSDAYPDFGKRTFYVERVDDLDRAYINADPDLQVQSGYRQIDLLQKFIYQPRAGQTHMLNLQYSTSSDIPRYDRLTQESGGLPRFAQWYYGPQERLLAGYHLNLDNKTGFYDHARFILAYQAIEESRHDRRFRKDVLNHRTENLDILTLNVDFDRMVEQHELRYGLEGTYNDVSSSAFTEDIVTGERGELDTRYPNGGSMMGSAAIYFTHTIELNDRWIINDGIRLSTTRLDATLLETPTTPVLPFNSIKQSYGALNGNLGVVFMPAEGLRFTLQAATGFRAPNVDDISKVFESVPGRVMVPNPELQAENTYNIDFGVLKSFRERVNVGIDLYHTWYRDAITTAPGQWLGQDSIIYDGQMSRVMTMVNAGKGYIYGFNAYFNADLSRKFSVSSTINYTHGRLLTDSVPYPLDHIPPLFGKTSVVFNLRKFKSELFVAYNGWKRLKDYNLLGEDNIAYATADGMPSWYTLNLRTAYQINERLQVQAALENILDRNYRVFASNISAPGRNLVLTVRANL